MSNARRYMVCYTIKQNIHLCFILIAKPNFVAHAYICCIP